VLSELKAYITIRRFAQMASYELRTGYESLVAHPDDLIDVDDDAEDQEFAPLAANVCVSPDSNKCKTILKI
jgi:hypothetical protein